MKSSKNFGSNATVKKESVRDMKIDWSKVCVLDPKATEVLQPSDKNKFDYFVFGGILGDVEFNGRTGTELTEHLPKEVTLRHLGEKQFSTDNALFVSKMILDGKPLVQIPLQWEAEVEIKDGESILLPYCYPLVNGKPQISKDLVTYLKRKKGF